MMCMLDTGQRRRGVILDGHVGLDLECFDRIYVNGWVPNLQVPGQVVNFLTHHLGFPIPSQAILERIGLRFRKAVTEFAAANDIPVVRHHRSRGGPPGWSIMTVGDRPRRAGGRSALEVHTSGVRS